MTTSRGSEHNNCTNNGDYERNWLTLEIVILLIRVRASVVTPVLEIVVCSGGCSGLANREWFHLSLLRKGKAEINIQHDPLNVKIRCALRVHTPSKAELWKNASIE